VEERSVLVIGGGISGLAFAWHAARAGARPLVLEAAPRAGGCLDSRRTDAGYWFELGAHTLYNSYGALLEIAEGAARPPRIVARGEARKRFALLRDGALTTMGPISVFRRFSWWELARAAPRALFGRGATAGRSTREHFSRLVGAGNYRRVLAPFLSAVPSQDVDGFPAAGAGSLFKKRTRRKDVVKSFTFEGGVGAIVDAIAASQVEVATSAPVRTLARAGGRYEVTLEDGRAFAAPVAALAVDPATAARLAAPDHGALAAALGRVRTVEVDTIGAVVRRADVALPELAFVVAPGDDFWSVVSRDPVPDAEHRAFTFHFRPGLDRARRLARMCEVLAVREAQLVQVAERRTVLPAPAVGHGAIVAEIDAALRGGALAVTGNYFEGLAIEDCVLRSRAEWERVRR
jgi:UDP-galactopyranose mutase